MLLHGGFFMRGVEVMIMLIVFLSCILCACAVGALATISDIRGLVIPNILSVIVAASYVL